jgi:hypothetical protein
VRNTMPYTTARVPIHVNTTCAHVIRYMKSFVPVPLPLHHAGTQCFSSVPARPVTVPFYYPQVSP